MILSLGAVALLQATGADAATAPATTAAKPAAPTITITTPAAGTTYGTYSTVNAAFSCQNAASCVGTFDDGQPIYTDANGTAKGGYYSFSVTATSSTGATVTKSADYNVAFPKTCPAGYVALTFDDGPSPLTDEYVDALDKAGVKATFFDIGDNMEVYPSQTRYEVSEGMRLGDHTMTHPDLTTLTDPEITAELQGQQQLALSIAGVTEDIYRPPYGAEDSNTWDDAWALGLMEIPWTADTLDWTSPPTASIVSAWQAGAHNQAIILDHDGYPNTLAAIPQIVADMKKDGLCAGQIEPDFNAPILSEWGSPIDAVVAPWTPTVVNLPEPAPAPVTPVQPISPTGP